MLVFVLVYLKTLGPCWGRELLPILASVIYGYLTDSLLVWTGLLTFEQPTAPIGPSPLWMISLWFGFGATYNSSMNWLQRDYRISALVGCLIGPLAYKGGIALGLLHVGDSPLLTYAVISLQWAVALSLLPAIAQASFNLKWNREVVLRRGFCVSQFSLIWLIFTIGMPAILVVAGLIDIFRFTTRRTPATAWRFVATFYTYLSAEIIGLMILTGTWIVARGNEEKIFRDATRTQTLWATSLFYALRKIFGLGLEVEGLEESTPGPIVVLIRHTSVLDTILAPAVITYPDNVFLRFVVKRELLWDPCLDVAGNRTKNHFVDRSSRDRAKEIERLKILGQDLTPREGVIIFPEGTRFTPNRQARALKKIKESMPELHDRASNLKHLLPPRPTGTLALLDLSTDVLVVGHHGFDALTTWAQLWRGDLVGRTIRVHMWRISHQDIPKGSKERIDWLYDQWQRMDEWVDRIPANSAKAE